MSQLLRFLTPVAFIMSTKLSQNEDRILTANQIRLQLPWVEEKKNCYGSYRCIYKCPQPGVRNKYLIHERKARTSPQSKKEKKFEQNFSRTFLCSCMGKGSRPLQ